MPDMLVPLLKLPPCQPLIDELRAKGAIIRRANAHEIRPICEFNQKHFSQGWADEIMVGFARQPISVLVAIRDGAVIGFGAYECTRRGFFGPTGVAENERKKGIGKALLLASLWGLREMGYAYGIIGGAGPTEFYAQECGAIVVPDSIPGIYADPINKTLEI